MSPRSGAIAIAVLALIGASPGEAGEPKSFRDWIAGCDNLRNCTAIGFGAAWDAAYVKIEREGARDARATVTIVADMQPGTAFALSFDDPALPGLPAGPHSAGPSDVPAARLEVSEPSAVDALVASLRKASKLTITRTDPPGATPSDPKVSHVSLAGAVAALLYVDEQQGRLGTSTALIRRGSRPPATIPAQPTAPAIAAATAGAAPRPGQPPAALLARAKTSCGPEGGEVVPGEIQRLHGNLLLYWFDCRGMSGAYNHASALLVAPAGQPEAARNPSFRIPESLPALRQEPPHIPVNGTFDEATMTLSTFQKDRGLGDCGSIEEWVWNGSEFALALYAAMPVCLGVPPDDWPVLYRAVRR